MKCEICDRDTGRQAYCKLHAEAYRNIAKEYECWKKALEISWKEYLRQIADNPLTGQWAREVALHLAENEGK